MTDEFNEKLFKTYCKDPSGNIIKRFINNDYLGKFLLPHDDEIVDNISVYEQLLRIDEHGFKEIMESIKCGLPLNDYYKPKYYTMDDYNIDIYNVSSSVVYNLLNVLQNNNGLDKNDLVIHSASADDGPVFKRFRPRSQGRGFKIKKPTCHIRVSLAKV
jgi:ribosomal protein L22